MPYLTCIGGQGAVGKNVGGAGSRGYWIFRRSKTVIIRFGPVHVRRSSIVKIEWLRWTEVRKLTRSVEDAQKLLNKIVARKTKAEHGYTRLASGVKIL
jgi:hypothetical protein